MKAITMWLDIFKSNRCPITEHQKEWIESRLLWLCKNFGFSYLVKPDIITPRSEDVIHAVNASSREDIHNLCTYICKKMSVDPSYIEFEKDHDELPINYSQYKAQSPQNNLTTQSEYVTMTKHHVLYREKELDDPIALITSLAHEIAYIRLTDENGFITGDEEDAQWLTELTTIFFGFGVFAMSGKKLDEKRWEEIFLGNLPPPMYAYTLALFALCNGTSNPLWKEMLSWRGKKLFDQSMRYLFHSKETIFYPLHKNFDTQFIPNSWHLAAERKALAVAIEDYEYAGHLHNYLQSFDIDYIE